MISRATIGPAVRPPVPDSGLRSMSVGPATSAMGPRFPTRRDDLGHAVRAIRCSDPFGPRNISFRGTLAASTSFRGARGARPEPRRRSGSERPLGRRACLGSVEGLGSGLALRASRNAGWRRARAAWSPATMVSTATSKKGASETLRLTSPRRPDPPLSRQVLAETVPNPPSAATFPSRSRASTGAAGGSRAISTARACRPREAASRG